MITDPILLTVSGWVGKTYEEMEALYPSNHRSSWASSYGCWALARAAYSLRGVDLPEQYHAALDSRMFRTVFEPEPLDLVPICNHRLPIVTHVMIYLGDSTVIHAIEDSGVVAHPLTREPWYSRIARDEQGRRGFLRLRNQQPRDLSGESDGEPDTIFAASLRSRL